jgi:hypothetical protein
MPNASLGRGGLYPSCTATLPSSVEATRRQCSLAVDGQIYVCGYRRQRGRKHSKESGLLQPDGARPMTVVTEQTDGVSTSFSIEGWGTKKIAQRQYHSERAANMSRSEGWKISRPITQAQN